jgi:non-ribosomal peptide synthetase component F
MTDIKGFGEFPEEQLRIIQSCRHPAGTFVKISEDCIDQSIPDCFEERARTFADRPAITDDDGALSYRELNKAANRLSHLILATCGDDAEPIGVFVSPSLAIAVAFLAVLKAGKIYVPLDVSDPHRSLEAVFKDAGIKTVIVTNETEERARELLPSKRSPTECRSGDRRRVVRESRPKCRTRQSRVYHLFVRLNGETERGRTGSSQSAARQNESR